MSHVLPSLSPTEHQVVRMLAAESTPVSTLTLQRCCSPLVRANVGSALERLAARGIVEHDVGAAAWTAAPDWWLRARDEAPPASGARP